MASEMIEVDEENLANEPTNAAKEEMKRLRNAGMEYVSRTGKLIPAKSQSDVLCQCPQRCSDKIPPEVRNNLFAQFYKMGDHELQNDFLQAHIETLAIKQRKDRLTIEGRAPRRVTCRYLIPLLTDPKITISEGQLPTGIRKVEVCQKAFMHMFAITEKRIRIQREKLIARVKAHQKEEEDDADLFTELQMCEMRQGTVLKDFEVFKSELDRDMQIVNNFFINQLWKPEYISNAISLSKK